MERVNLLIHKGNRSVELEIIPERTRGRYVVRRNGFEYTYRSWSRDHLAAKYRNLHFKLSTDSRNKWRADLLDMIKKISLTNVVYRNGEELFFHGEPIMRKVPDAEACRQLLEACIVHNRSLYDQIENQAEFRRQMLREAEVHLTIYPSGEGFLDESERCFHSFIACEKDLAILPELLTPHSVLEKFPELNRCSLEGMTQALEQIIEDVVSEEKAPSISYNRQYLYNDIYHGVLDWIEETEDEQRQDRIFVRGEFPITSEEKRTIAQRLSGLYDCEWVCDELRHLVSVGQVENGTQLVSRLDEIMEKWLAFEKIYVLCAPSGYHKEINISEEKNRRFLLRERGDLILSEAEETEYLLCKAVKSHCVAILYDKDGTRLVPEMQRLPALMDFVEQITALLLETAIIAEHEGRFVYREDGDKKAFRDAVMKITA